MAFQCGRSFQALGLSDTLAIYVRLGPCKKMGILLSDARKRACRLISSVILQLESEGVCSIISAHVVNLECRLKRMLARRVALI